MTATTTERGSPALMSLGAVRPRRGLAITGSAGVAVVALILRVVNIRRSYDVFIDEVTYTRIARSIAEGQGVRLGGQPFDLHPPGALALFGLVDWVFELPSGTLASLLDLRLVSAVLGALACAGLYVVVRQVVSPGLALVAGLVLAVDPFAILYDSRVLLEAPAQLAAVLTVALLAVAHGAEATCGGCVAERSASAAAMRSAVRRHWHVWAAGLFAAITVCTKETFGVVLILMLVAILVTGWTHDRRAAVTVLGMAVAGYAISVICLGSSTGFGVWWHTVTGGAARLVGADQVTGFNAPTTHVTLVSRVFADAGQDAFTYLILVLGVLSAARMVWVRWRRRRFQAASVDERVGLLVALWTVAGAAYLGYATLFGTIEAQMYYICLLPCVASLTVFISARRLTVGRAAKRIVVVVVVAALAFDGVTWARVHTVPDNDYVQLIRWESRNVPHGSVVAATETTAQFLLQNVVIGQWATPNAFRAHRVDYVVVSTTLTNEGYALSTPGLLRWLDRHGQLVFDAKGATTGHLEVFDVRGVDGASR